MSVVGESLNGGVLSVKVNDAVMMSLRAGLLVLALGFAPADGQTMCSLLDPLLTTLTESTPLTCTCENTGSALQTLAAMRSATSYLGQFPTWMN